MMNGRSNACGTCPMAHSMVRAKAGQGGSRRTSVVRAGGMKRISGPRARSPLTMRAPSGSASFWPSPVAVALTPSTFACCAPM